MINYSRGWNIFIFLSDFFQSELDSDSSVKYPKSIKLRATETSSVLKVLHFAPEQAFYKLFRNLKNIEYTTTDLFSPLADVKADICNLPFEDNSYDIIFCNHVLEHIPDDTKAMQELYRVLKPL